MIPWTKFKCDLLSYISLYHSDSYMDVSSSKYVDMSGVYPVIKPWDALVGLVSVASSLPLCVISGEELRFFRFHLLVASRVCKATATWIKNDFVSVKSRTPYKCYC